MLLQDDYPFLTQLLQIIFQNIFVTVAYRRCYCHSNLFTIWQFFLPRVNLWIIQRWEVSIINLTNIWCTLQELMMMMMMMMMNCFYGMVDRRKAFSLISSRDHCQRSSPSWISDKPRAGHEPAHDLSSGLVKWSCTVVITTTPRLTVKFWKYF